ncbi:MAG: S-layer homology domain-containing protein [Clostridia bacterium]|nr:S-layer homology domain-containing protein [Clostridia bacterium]
MKTKKLSLAAGVSVCVLIALLTAVYALLTDTPASAEKPVLPCDIEESFAKEAIVWAVENGFMQAELSEGNAYFSPKREATRGEIAKVLITYLEIDVKAYENTEIGFADEAKIPKALLPYVRAALSRGYIKLYADYTYRAESPVSREETADIFAPLCNMSVSAGKSERFSDFSEVSLYFEDNVKKIVDLDIMIGYPDGMLRPKNTITREELAMVLYRFAELRQ